MLAVIASQEGIQRVHAAVPSAEIYACTIDPELNSHKYIVPVSVMLAIGFSIPYRMTSCKARSIGNKLHKSPARLTHWGVRHVVTK